MNTEEFRINGHKVVDWVADYLENIEKLPVKSQVLPREIFDMLSDTPPLDPEPFSDLMKDLEEIILPGITHWQHPGFHAFFNANSSYPSLLAEMIMSGIGAQCMIWETSPAAAELEEMIMEWFKQMMNLPKSWHGVIQDTASTATLSAMLSAREWKTAHSINENGYQGERLRVYCSEQTHSSVEKGAKIAGFGRKNLVKIPVLNDLSLNPMLLEKAIAEDINNGFTPCIVISTQGTTGTLAFDDVERIGSICEKYDCWHHVDAAWAGNAYLLPEMQHYTHGFDKVDSYVFNPHKWLFTNFDASVYFVKDKEALLSTFEILPEYLKTRTRGKVNDYRDWGIPLGRRFRALKLWFVIRTYGLNGLQHKISEHIDMAKWLEDEINRHPDFELMAPPTMNLVVLRYHPKEKNTNLNELNEKLLNRINDSGKAYITHTKIKNDYVIRVNFGGTHQNMSHAYKIWDLLKNKSELI